MDAATLRIVLIILGALFLFGMYLWERRRARAADDDDWDERDDDPRDRREPGLGAYDDDTDGPAEPASAPYRREASATDDPWAASGFDADLDDSAPEPSSSDADDATEPADTLIVQLYVVARDGSFSGEEIMAAAERHNLAPGDMAIFHRRKVDGAGRSAPFSMANAFNPGTFPFDDMSGFATRGLVLFARLDGATSDLMVFDELVQTASDLAAELDGELLDNARQALGDEQLQRLRAEVLELLNGIAESDGP